MFRSQLHITRLFKVSILVTGELIQTRSFREHNRIGRQISSERWQNTNTKPRKNVEMFVSSIENDSSSWKPKAESKQKWYAYGTVYTQSPADNNFHRYMYFKFAYSRNMFDPLETEIQKPGKENTYLSLLSDCLLSAVFDGSEKGRSGSRSIQW